MREVQCDTSSEAPPTRSLIYFADFEFRYLLSRIRNLPAAKAKCASRWEQHAHGMMDPFEATVSSAILLRRRQTKQQCGLWRGRERGASKAWVCKRFREDRRNIP